MTRDEVFDVISGERDYQEAQGQDDESHVKPEITMGETLAAIDHNMHLARGVWYGSNDKNHQGAMEYLRKVAALVVQFGEGHGIPRREGF